MLKAILVRLSGAVPVILLVSLVMFGLFRLAPGDAADMLVPPDASDAEVALARARWGLDRPVIEQYGRFLINAASLDFGTSYRYHEDVGKLIASRLPATLELALSAILIATLIAIPAGIVAALKRGRFLDGLVSVLAIAGVSAPTFWLGIMLVLVVSAQFNLLPSSGRLPYGTGLVPVTGFDLIDAALAGRFDLFRLALSHLVLPAVTLALNIMGIIARVTRGAVIEVAQEEFISTAVAKGLSRFRIVWRHILPNALIPIITIVGLELGTLISGSIIVEVVFAWPGLGSLLYEGITVRDVPLTMGVVVVYTCLFILLNLAIDLAYFVIDPRLRAGRAA
jgi:ABC-type dipeptide/oligopeptide/nickel transport system permease component